VGIGVAVSLGLTRFMQSLLFDITPTDAATFVAIAALLGGTALAAGLVPARRAAAIDPVVSLRAE
jgi:ABC-type antimicrobial peptide transport system permease subunit